MLFFRSLPRYWHTLKYLKPVQFYWRAWYRFARPVPDTSPAPALRKPGEAKTWCTPARRKPSMIQERMFRYLDVSAHLDDIGWDDPAYTKLWRYNQHYFDDLNAENHDDRTAWHVDLIGHWMNNNAIGMGSGWEPYPTSLRIVNWIKWSLSGQPVSDDIRHNIAVQARWLTKRLEWHLLGNHLFANAKALLYAGLFFEGGEADRFRKIALDILVKEVPEQILHDGGHFELTPMYHAIAVEDMLDILNILKHYHSDLTPREEALQAECQTRIPRMLDWLANMSHPDGNISFFNDAAFEIAPQTSELFRFAGDQGFSAPAPAAGLVHMKDSGFVRLACGLSVVLADIGKIGPNYLPGHAHADTLSFEWSHGRQRVFVNSGTSLYGLGAERLRQRSTAAHNTVVVCNKDSSEVWSGFRVARRATVHNIITAQTLTSLTASANHDGYKRLDGRLVHHRKWVLSAMALKITDTVTPDAPAAARYHLHPDVHISQETPQTGMLHLPDGSNVRWTCSGGRAVIEDTTWHPEFGKSVANKCLALNRTDTLFALTLNWS